MTTTCCYQMRAYNESACRDFEKKESMILKCADTPYAPDVGPDKLIELCEARGVFQDSASHYLMQLLYSARIATPQIMVAITRLASRVVSWDADCDRKLIRIFAYLKGNSDVALWGSLKVSDMDEVVIAAWPDADLAGNRMSTKSTSGRFIELLHLPSGRSMPLTWKGKSQPASSHSTPEAETVSLDACVREDCIPLQSLFNLILKRNIEVVVFEDNESCIAIVGKGFSAALAYIARTQRIDIGFLHEIFVEGLLDEYGAWRLEYTPSATQKGDLFTKELGSLAEFEHALKNIGMRKM